MRPNMTLDVNSTYCLQLLLYEPSWDASNVYTSLCRFQLRVYNSGIKMLTSKNPLVKFYINKLTDI